MVGPEKNLEKASQISESVRSRDAVQLSLAQGEGKERGSMLRERREGTKSLFRNKKALTKDPFFLTRFAFYQAGKATLQPFFHLTSKTPLFSLSNSSSPKIRFLFKKKAQKSKI